MHVGLRHLIKSIAFTFNLATLNALAISGTNVPNNEGQLKVFTYYSYMAQDPDMLKQRGVDAVNKLVGALRTNVKDPVELNFLNAKFKFSDKKPISKGDILAQFEDYKRNLKPNDSIIIYSHTHGGNNARRPDKKGLMIGTTIPREVEVIKWSDYADLILSLPAKNIVVMTMSCFSGALVDALNEPEKKSKIEKIKAEGRNLLVITSQSNARPSNPSRINGAVINSMAFSAITLFEGKADGFRNQSKDKVIRLQEIADYVMDTTANTGFRNTNEPQIFKSIQSNDEIFRVK